MIGSLQDAMTAESPLQIAGVINAYAAIQAEKAGFKAIYVSGSGVATASYGLPDLAVTGLSDVVTDVRRISDACDLPLLVDCDTGWGGALNIARSVQQMERAGAAAIHIEDQVQEKRCGHLPGKQIVSVAEMCDRIKAAVDGRVDRRFMILARTDALAVDDLQKALERVEMYVGAGADGIFAEAVTELDQYSRFKEVANRPVLANITEFGVTPLFTTRQLSGAGVDMALYPLSAFRAMSKAAESVYADIRRHGTQKASVGQMHTRSELYETIGYEEYQDKVDRLFGSAGVGG